MTLTASSLRFIRSSRVFMVLTSKGDRDWSGSSRMRVNLESADGRSSFQCANGVGTPGNFFSRVRFSSTSVVLPRNAAAGASISGASWAQ